MTAVSTERKVRESIEHISNQRLPGIYKMQADLYDAQIGIIEDIVDVLNELYMKDVMHVNTNGLTQQVAYLSKEIGDLKKCSADVRGKL